MHTRPMWVWGCGLLMAAQASAAGEKTTCRDSALREGPGAYFEIVQPVAKGSKVATGETRDSWVSVRSGATEGWMPSKAFEPGKPGMDYMGMLSESGAVTLSSVDIAAATKGWINGAYSNQYTANLPRLKQLDRISVDRQFVSSLRLALRDRSGEEVLSRLPYRKFENTMILAPDAEAELGRTLAAARLVTTGFVDDLRVIRYVNAVAAVVGAKTERYDVAYRVAILDDAGVNGFGLPGGYILITRGLLNAMQDEAELACALGHEMAHVSLYHGVREFKKRDKYRHRDEAFAELEKATGNPPGEVELDLQDLADEAYLKIIAGRARADEFEADLFGAAYAAAAGYEPDALADLLTRVDREHGGQDMFRHHPPSGDRLVALKEGVAKYHLRWQGQKRLQERFAKEISQREGR